MHEAWPPRRWEIDAPGPSNGGAVKSGQGLVDPIPDVLERCARPRWKGANDQGHIAPVAKGLEGWLRGA